MLWMSIFVPKFLLLVDEQNDNYWRIHRRKVLEIVEKDWKLFHFENVREGAKKSWKKFLLFTENLQRDFVNAQRYSLNFIAGFGVKSFPWDKRLHNVCSNFQEEFLFLFVAKTISIKRYNVRFMVIELKPTINFYRPICRLQFLSERKGNRTDSTLRNAICTDILKYTKLTAYIFYSLLHSS